MLILNPKLKQSLILSSTFSNVASRSLTFPQHPGKHDPLTRLRQVWYCRQHKALYGHATFEQFHEQPIHLLWRTRSVSYCAAMAAKEDGAWVICLEISRLSRTCSGSHLPWIQMPRGNWLPPLLDCSRKKVGLIKCITCESMAFQRLDKNFIIWNRSSCYILDSLTCRELGFQVNPSTMYVFCIGNLVNIFACQISEPSMQVPVVIVKKKE